MVIRCMCMGKSTNEICLCVKRWEKVVVLILLWWPYCIPNMFVRLCDSNVGSRFFGLRVTCGDCAGSFCRKCGQAHSALTRCQANNNRCAPVCVGRGGGGEEASCNVFM